MSITVQHQKEALGQAYVRAVIAKAGFNFGKSEHDYGYDGTIKEVVNRGGRYVESCFGINFTVETSVYYAEALTQTVSPPKVFTLDNSHFLFIDEISKRYKDCTLVEDVTLKGTIKMLSKSPSAGGDEEENTVRLLTKIDGQMRSISLHLPPDKHALACNAYRDDKEVCISGTIDKSGKYWFFTEVTEFTVI